MAERKTKILIVDDDHNVRNLYSDVFQEKGFDVYEAIDGSDGLDKAQKISPDLVFTGIVMPRLDGFGLIEALRNNAATNKIPIIMSSHLGREEDKKKAEKMGVTDFIVLGYYKPYEVVEKVRALFATQEYELRVIPNDLGARELAKDMNIKDGLRCKKCDGELILTMKLVHPDDRTFYSKLKCIRCGTIN